MADRALRSNGPKGVYGRRNFPVPAPWLASFDALNFWLEEQCLKRQGDIVRGHAETVGDRLMRDRDALMALPPTPYDACDKISTPLPGRALHAQEGATSISMVRYRNNDYSVPVACAHHEVHPLADCFAIACRGMVERIWRLEGLKVPAKQPRKGRLWLYDGSCVRLSSERPNHVWSCDFVQDRTCDGRVYRMLNIIDEFTQEALVIRVKRRLNSTNVVDALTDLFILRGPPAFIRSDNGAEFIARKVRAWTGAVGAKTAFIAPGSPWENGYCESFNARFRDALLNGEVFTTLQEAQNLIERWRRHYNTVRSHSALGYRPPAPKRIVPINQRLTMH